jgi:hypothetical protein
MQPTSAGAAPASSLPCYSRRSGYPVFQAVASSSFAHGCAPGPSGSLPEGELVWVRLCDLKSWEGSAASLGRDGAAIAFVRPLHEAVVRRSAGIGAGQPG